MWNNCWNDHVALGSNPTSQPLDNIISDALIATKMDSLQARGTCHYVTDWANDLGREPSRL